MNLENEKSATSVQQCREVTTTNGCNVTLVFRPQSNPQVREDVAEMLLAAFERRSVHHETGALSVQSFNKRSR